MKKKSTFSRELDLDAAIEQVETAIDKELAKQPPKRQRQYRYSDADKAALAKAALKRWQTRAKRAQTYITKYRKKIRYYEKKLTT